MTSESSACVGVPVINEFCYLVEFEPLISAPLGLAALDAESGDCGSCLFRIAAALQALADGVESGAGDASDVVTGHVRDARSALLRALAVTPDAVVSAPVPQSESVEPYAVVSWSASDVLELRPDWSEERAHAFLQENERHLSSLMIERGWSAIEGMLPAVDGSDEKGGAVYA